MRINRHRRSKERLCRMQRRTPRLTARTAPADIRSLAPDQVTSRKLTAAARQDTTDFPCISPKISALYPKQEDIVAPNLDYRSKRSRI
jgi:hypothetical protein